jgi:hypothetical protein
MPVRNLPFARFYAAIPIRAPARPGPTGPKRTEQAATDPSETFGKVPGKRRVPEGQRPLPLTGARAGLRPFRNFAPMGGFDM